MTTRYHLTASEVAVAAKQLAVRLHNQFFEAKDIVRVYGIPRGGIPAAFALIAAYGTGMRLVDTPAAATVIVDDIHDSGATMRRTLQQYPSAFGAVLYSRQPPPLHIVAGEILPADIGWLVFPWESAGEGSDTSTAEDIPVRLLQYIGENPAREGLLETPARFIKAWQHWTSGYGVDTAKLLKTFEDGGEGYDEVVLVKGIPVYSHCEHHLAPFFGVAHVGYIPNGRVVGLSKLARLVDAFARRLQVQERLTVQIATALEEALRPKGVAVVVECRHMCMESRGVQRQGASTTTSAMRGVFLTGTTARQEFLSLINKEG